MSFLLSFNMRQIAAMLNVHRRTVAAWRADGELPPPDFVLGKVIRWRRETIERWLQRQRGTAKEQTHAAIRA